MAELLIQWSFEREVARINKIYKTNNTSSEKVSTEKNDDVKEITEKMDNCDINDVTGHSKSDSL